jgi:hypothetical protein
MITKGQKIHDIFDATELDILQTALENRIDILSQELTDAKHDNTGVDDLHIKSLEKMLEKHQVLLNQVL